MKKILLLGLAALLMFAACKKDEDPTMNVDTKDIVILYDNDVHCEITGYPKMAALRKQMLEQTDYVAVVSSGDFLSGNVYGSVSKGGFLVRLMNAVGYDYATLGNHEFDYSVATMMDTLSNLSAKVLCCNFRRISDDNSIYAGYDIRNYGNRKVAFVGVTSPATLKNSTPIYFRDRNGAFRYTFCEDKLTEVLQQQVNLAHAEGADKVVLLSHIGVANNEIQNIIAATYGIDVVLDAHSHSVISGTHIANKKGEEVLLTSTGKNFQYIGCLVLKADGTISSELLATENIADDADVKHVVDQITDGYEETATRHIGYSYVYLSVYDENSYYAARSKECNIGDFCADALRSVFEADIAVINGGGIRNNIEAGEVTFSDIYSVFPFNNTCSLISVSGQDILDALELSCYDLHANFGGFLQVSGLRFTVDTTVNSSVVVDDNGIFVRVAGARRISNVEVWNRTSNHYEPLLSSHQYTLASNDFIALNKGNGYVFSSSQVLRASVCSDVEVLERYITEYLDGTISDTYATFNDRILFK